MNNRHYGHDLQYKQIIYIKNVVYLLIAEGSRLVDVQDDVRVVVVVASPYHDHSWDLNRGTYSLCATVPSALV